METPAPRASESNGQVGDLVHRIGNDLKTIARDELELVRGELQGTARTVATEVAVALFFGIVALIGLGMFCVAAVAALEPVISSLALRLLIMGAAYLVVGGAIAGAVGSRLKRDASPDLKVPTYEAKRTLAGAKESIQHG